MVHSHVLSVYKSGPHKSKLEPEDPLSKHIEYDTHHYTKEKSNEMKKLCDYHTVNPTVLT